MVKRLQIQSEETKVLHTKITQDRKEAIDKKIKLLQGSILGRPLVKFDVTGMRDVWVPYCYLVYYFNAKRITLFKKGGLEKKGEVGVIFDLNEAHPMQYDFYESGELELVKKAQPKDERIIMQPNISSKEILQQTEEYLQNNIMKRFYGSTGELTLIKKQKFFRPAVEMDVLYRQRNENKRYVYLDDFGIQSEHVLGLKYRVENSF